MPARQGNNICTRAQDLHGQTQTPRKHGEDKSNIMIQKLRVHPPASAGRGIGGSSCESVGRCRLMLLLLLLLLLWLKLLRSSSSCQVVRGLLLPQPVVRSHMTRAAAVTAEGRPSCRSAASSSWAWKASIWLHFRRSLSIEGIARAKKELQHLQAIARYQENHEVYRTVCRRACATLHAW